MNDMRDDELPSRTAMVAQRGGGRGGSGIGLALGGGAARGLAHIPMLEVLDEMGVRPSVIAGTSMGAILGACYAAGMSGREIRDYACDLFSSRAEPIKRLLSKWPDSLASLWNPMRPAMFDAVAFFEIMMPSGLPETFEQLDTPFIAVASDFYEQEQVLLSSGALIEAVAASSALPALLRPVERDGRVLIDGGFVNPTPFDILTEKAALTVAIDVTGKPSRDGGGIPNSLDAVIGSALITLSSIIREKLKSQAPDILMRPDVNGYRALNFYKIGEILEAADKCKEPFRHALEEKLEAAAV